MRLHMIISIVSSHFERGAHLLSCSFSSLIFRPCLLVALPSVLPFRLLLLVIEKFQNL